MNVQDAKINIQKSIVFPYTNRELTETNKDQNPIASSVKSNEIIRNKFNQGGE